VLAPKGILSSSPLQAAGLSNGVKINDILPDNLLAVQLTPLQLLSSQF
jgi:hypothetical protein